MSLVLWCGGAQVGTKLTAPQHRHNTPVCTRTPRTCAKKKLLVKGLGNESLLHKCYVIRWHVFMSGSAADRWLPIGHAHVSSHDLTNLQGLISHSPVAKTVPEASESRSEQELVSHDPVLIMHFVRTMLAVSDSTGPSQPSTRMREMMDCCSYSSESFGDAFRPILPRDARLAHRQQAETPKAGVATGKLIPTANHGQVAIGFRT